MWNIDFAPLSTITTTTTATTTTTTTATTTTTTTTTTKGAVRHLHGEGRDALRAPEAHTATN